MSHPQIEEVSDSDPSEGNISDLGSSDDDFDEREILKRRTPTSKPTPPSSSSTQQRQQSQNHILTDPTAIPSSLPQGSERFQSTTDDSKYKDYQCVYPVYFDKNRSRAEGRRVGLENAVENPMAREIVAACGRLRLDTLFEPAKLHPKDWSNPGRVKIKLKGTNNPLVNNKHHLYTLIAAHLKQNPTTEASALRVKVPGAPTPDPNKPYPKPAIPRGWKMGSILPYYSPAMTGGGVSDNFFKDMMAEMQAQGQIPGGAGGGGGGGLPALDALAASGGNGGGGGGAGNGGGKKEKKKKKK